MKFIDKKTCEKLLALGCKSESGFYYNYYDGGECTNPVRDKREVQAFTPYDFLSDSKQAFENCRIVFLSRFALLQASDQNKFVTEWVENK